jgi:hypothetical protein
MPREAVGELIVSGGGGAVDLEVRGIIGLIGEPFFRSRKNSRRPGAITSN